MGLKKAEISVSMIVKDEYQNLMRLLPQIMQFSQEICIVDTGSTDGTLDYLQRLTTDPSIKVGTFPWNDNFSDARNASLDLCTKGHVLWLDADDYLPQASIRALQGLYFDETAPKEYCVLPVKVSEAGGITPQARLVPRIPGLRWQGHIHEAIFHDLEAAGYTARFLDIPIHHLGYDDEETNLKKQERNLRILESSPYDPFWTPYYMGLSLNVLKRHREALREFTKAYLWASQREGAWASQARYLIGVQQAALGENGAAIRDLEKSERPEALFLLGDIYQQEKRHGKAARVYVDAFVKRLDQPVNIFGDNCQQFVERAQRHVSKVMSKSIECKA